MTGETASKVHSLVLYGFQCFIASLGSGSQTKSLIASRVPAGLFTSPHDDEWDGNHVCWLFWKSCHWQRLYSRKGWKKSGLDVIWYFERLNQGECWYHSVKSGGVFHNKSNAPWTVHLKADVALKEHKARCSQNSPDVFKSVYWFMETHGVIWRNFARKVKDSLLKVHNGK